MARADKPFKRLKAALLDNTLDAEMRKLTGIQLLIIDDLTPQRLAQPRPATSTSYASNGTRRPPQWSPPTGPRRNG
jgi:hypothetical protein